MVFGLALVIALILALAGCGNGEQAQNDAPGSNETTHSSSEETAHSGDSNTATGAAGEGAQELTPIVGQVPYAPIPFNGSDGRTHLVYELEATNFTGGETSIEQLEVLDADTDDVVATLDTKEVSGRLQPAGLRDTAGALDPSMTAIIFLHVVFDKAEEVPDRRRRGRPPAKGFELHSGRLVLRRVPPHAGGASDQRADPVYTALRRRLRATRRRQPRLQR
jgi:hypothetical protein